VKERTAVIGNEQLAVVWTESGGIVQATVGERQYDLKIRRLANGTYWFGWNGISAEVVVTPQDQGYEVSINGHHVRVEFLESSKRLHRHASAASGGIVEVRAPMPGKVVRVLARESEEVRAHQGILVIEAMKMQNEIRSPKAGRVIEVAVREGDAVRSGDLIARVE
jgi:biotin carboxyl carrier protein